MTLNPDLSGPFVEPRVIRQHYAVETVSYTHLTLPTIYSV